MEGKILVVDDEPVVVKSCERILTPEGYTVDAASNGREAVDKLSKDNFDLVITDLMMPDMDGLELLRWIRNSKQDTGVIVITGYPSQESIKEALSLRIIDYLPRHHHPRRRWPDRPGRALQRTVRLGPAGGIRRLR